MNSKERVTRLTLSAMLAALVFVATSFFKLPVSVTQGYIHLGDGFILLGAMLLGSPAIIAAALGSALADLLGGYTVYILPTFIITGAVAAVAVWAFASERPMWVRLLGAVVAEAVMVAGYFVAEWLVLGYGLAAAAGALVPNLMQGISGIVIVFALTPMVRQVKKILKL